MPDSTATLESAIATLLEAYEAAPPAALGQRDLVRRALEFANSGRPTGLPGASVLTRGGHTFYLSSPELDSQRAEFQSDLAAMLQGALSGPRQARLLKQARHVTVRGYEVVGGELRQIERHFVSDLQPVLADVLLLIKSDPTWQVAVKQCRLPGCERFFLASDQVVDPSAPGRRRHRYCSAEHMALGQTSGAERTRRWRVEKAKRAAAAAKHK